MSELRLNVVTKEWVIIAPERSTRPRELKAQVERPKLPAYDPACPFCPGNEHETETELHREPDGEGWATRVVLNRYPVLTRQEASPAHKHHGLRHSLDGFGAHEVVIDTPRHDLATAMMGRPQLETLMRTCRDRFRALMEDPRIGHVLIFKNHGLAAGTSLIHPHSQVVATSVVSYQVRDRIRTLEDHEALYGECVLCQMIDQEATEGVRVVFINDSFVAFVPYAALSAFHIWIFPLRHMATFGEVTDDEARDLAETLHVVLGKLYFGLGDPDFNYVIRSAPRNCASTAFHWYMSVVPRLGRAAGFELGSGMYVNDRYPEDAAEFLSKIEVPER